MDITFGVIPTIVLAFQSYRLGRNLATEYKTFNDDLRRVLTDIATTTAIFKHTIDQLVGEIAGDTPELTFEYLGSGKWDKDDLNAQLESILGDLLLLMTGTAISPPGKKHKLSFLRWPNSVAPVTPPTIEVNPLRSEFKTTQIQSTRKKLLSVANSHLPGLRGLLDELRTHKDNSRAALKHALRKVSRSTAGNSTEISRIPPRRNSDNQNCDITRTCFRSRTVQAASQNLYRMISQALGCECHSTYLCLDRQVNNTPTKNSKGKLKQQPPQTVEPEPHFSFRMTVKSGDGNKNRFSTITPPLRLVFIGHSFQDTDFSPTNSAIERRICEELSCSNKAYEKRIRDSTGFGNSGFLLRRVTFSDGATKTSDSVQVLSLGNLIASRHPNLYHLDRFLIAINLAYSLVNFYSSPWVRDWSLETIHYFEKQETTGTIGLWTPHLSLICGDTERRVGDENKEVYLLGHILLQLGGNRKFGIPQGEGRELALESAFEGLSREMGPGYVRFVRNCLTSWSDRSMDLMKDDNLNAFVSQISVLEKRTQCW